MLSQSTTLYWKILHCQSSVVFQRATISNNNRLLTLLQFGLCVTSGALVGLASYCSYDESANTYYKLWMDTHKYPQKRNNKRETHEQGRVGEYTGSIPSCMAMLVIGSSKTMAQRDSQ